MPNQPSVIIPFSDLFKIPPWTKWARRKSASLIGFRRDLRLIQLLRLVPDA